MKEDIIKMAREAGFEQAGHLSHQVFTAIIERFAALVEDAQSKRTFDEGFVTVGHMRQQIAAERNKVASWMMTKGYATGHGDTTEDLLKELEWQVRESERKACLNCYSPDDTAEDWADKIRARGQS
jgi:hypothetical protein